jgi:hypothetical protein
MRVMLTSPTLEREHTMTKREAKAEVIDLKGLLTQDGVTSVPGTGKWPPGIDRVNRQRAPAGDDFCDCSMRQKDDVTTY